jgi:hypothetical protein
VATARAAAAALAPSGTTLRTEAAEPIHVAAGTGTLARARQDDDLLTLALPVVPAGNRLLKACDGP